MIRVVLPAHLRALAHVDGEVHLDITGPVTQRSVLDALEARYPVLRGTIRGHDGGPRRAFIRFFACELDPVPRPARRPAARCCRRRDRALSRRRRHGRRIRASARWAASARTLTGTGQDAGVLRQVPLRQRDHHAARAQASDGKADALANRHSVPDPVALHEAEPPGRSKRQYSEQAPSSPPADTEHADDRS